MVLNTEAFAKWQRIQLKVDDSLQSLVHGSSDNRDVLSLTNKVDQGVQKNSGILPPETATSTVVCSPSSAEAEAEVPTDLLSNGLRKVFATQDAT